MKHPRRLTYWQKLWLLSRVNGQDNMQEMLPVNGWQFPQGTWLQRRLEEKRREQEPERRAGK